MTPVDQTVEGVGGNCYQACLASVLDLPLDAVPHFVAIEGPTDPSSGALWFFEARLWLRETFGLDLYSYDTADEPTPRGVFASADLAPCQQAAIGCGKSPRGDFLHAVVVDLDGVMVHDPHWSRSGIAGPLTAFEVLAPPRDDYTLRPTPTEEAR